MSNKVNVTLSIDKDIKRDFKVQTIIDGMDMSEAVENMMKNYTIASKNMHEQKD